MIFCSPKSGLTSGAVRKKLAFEEIQELLEEDGLQGHSGAGRPYLQTISSPNNSNTELRHLGFDGGRPSSSKASKSTSTTPPQLETATSRSGTFQSGRFLTPNRYPHDQQCNMIDNGVTPSMITMNDDALHPGPHKIVTQPNRL